MENKKYKRRKKIFLQVYLAVKGARAGQGKGGRVEKNWNHWLLTFYMEVLCDGCVHYWNAQWSIIPYIEIVYLHNYLVNLSPPPLSEASLSRNEEVVVGERKVGHYELHCLWHLGYVYRKANVESKMVYLLFLLNRKADTYIGLLDVNHKPFKLNFSACLKNFKRTVFEFTKSFFCALVCCWTPILNFFHCYYSLVLFNLFSLLKFLLYALFWAH